MPFKNQILSLKNELTVLITIFISFASPIIGLFYLVGMAVFLDTFFAIYTSIKLKGLKSITSHNLFNSCIKTFFYMGTVLMAYTASVHITGGEMLGIKMLLPKVVCAFWIFIEIKSIDETSIKLGNKPLLDILNSIIVKLKTFKKDLNDLK